jgi:basic membrane protein A
VHTVTEKDQRIKTLEQYAKGNYDVIICSGYNWFSALSTVSSKYPEQKFSIIDASGLHKDNVSEYIFEENEGGYLVGLIAAAQALDEGIENPQFGFIGGVRCDPLTRYETGYMQGIAQLIPDAVFYEYYTDSWNAPYFAEDKAHSWYSQGVYCIFPCAGATSSGAINSAKKMRYKGKNVWAIGADSDMYYDGIYKPNQSAILTSSLKQNDKASFDTLQRVEQNIWSPSTHTLDSTNGGIEYSRSNIQLSHNAIAYAEKAKTELEKGTLIVYKNLEQARKNGAITEDFQIIQE